jgi:hypothetical protein
MGFFGMLFWIAVFWLAYKAIKSWGGCGSREVGDDQTFQRRDRDADQQAYVESLETRLAELEERLDFTERLLAEKRESAA